MKHYLLRSKEEGPTAVVAMLSPMHSRRPRKRPRRLLRMLSTLCLVSLALVVQPPTWMPRSTASTSAQSLTIGQRSDSIVLLWNEAVLQGVRDSGMGPPMVARALAIVHTCTYDAWAAYDARAVGTRLGDTLRRPVRERTLPHKRKAISFAAYRAAVDLFPATTPLFNDLMASLEYDPFNTTTDTTKPSGIGNVACGAVLEFRHHDGSNQLGDIAPGPYSDYTGYVPANEPMDTRYPMDESTVRDVNYWQPLTWIDKLGVLVTPKAIGPHWTNVIPFALSSTSQFRSPTGPARYGSDAFVQQALDLVELSANLTDRQKSIAEYWADGPSSELPPGHWDVFAQFVSRRDGHGRGIEGIDADTKMFFALTNAVFDAGIVAWDNKFAFDSVRPITAIRWLFYGQDIEARGGSGEGTETIKGEEWLPYQRTYFLTPPFPEYSSGHSTFSAAGARILELFTGSKHFGLSITIPAGSSLVEPGITPARDVTLSWETFREAAVEAGLSRRFGGIHFRQGDLDGRIQGRLAADQAWEKALTYFNGTADY